jgi:hypothetical protein
LDVCDDLPEDSAGLVGVCGGDAVLFRCRHFQGRSRHVHSQGVPLLSRLGHSPPRDPRMATPNILVFPVSPIGLSGNMLAGFIMPGIHKGLFHIKKLDDCKQSFRIS